MWNTYKIKVTLKNGLEFSLEFQAEIGTSSDMVLIKGLYELQLVTPSTFFALEHIKDVDVKYVEEDWFVVIVSIEFECKCGNKLKRAIKSLDGEKDISETINSGKHNKFEVNHFHGNMIEVNCKKCEDTDWIVL